MFGFDKIAFSDLKVSFGELKKENERLKAANDAYQKRLVDEMASASFAIDWDAMNAFSVERVWDNGLHKTIIGWKLEEPIITTEGDDQKVTTKDVVREWYLFCSAEKHEELVKEFKEWMAKKKINLS